MIELSKIRIKNNAPYILPPKIYNGDELVYDISDGTIPAPPNYSRQYFTIRSLEDNNEIKFMAACNHTGATYPTDIPPFYWSKDGQTWKRENWSGFYSGVVDSVILNKNEKIYIKSEREGWLYSNNSNGRSTQQYFTSNKTVALEGNIMSLNYGDNFASQYSFKNNSHASTWSMWTFPILPKTIVYAHNLILQATTLKIQCYQKMFENCTLLRTIPKLPATTLDWLCYNRMFYGCTSLVVGPSILPAITLADNCYDQMFYGCTSLVTTPILPATTLAEGCYLGMFSGCTSLTTAPSVLPATTLAKSCYESMFEKCTSLVNAPKLSVNRLVESCYNNMFRDCTSLSTIICLATNISATKCVAWWVYNVAETGTFYKSAWMHSWPTGNSGIPEGWTVVDYVE